MNPHCSSLMCVSIISEVPQEKGMKDMTYNANCEIPFHPDVFCLYFLGSGTTMNCEKYLKLLQNKLKLHIHIYGCSIFMHYNAQYYKAKIS